MMQRSLAAAAAACAWLMMLAGRAQEPQHCYTTERVPVQNTAAPGGTAAPYESWDDEIVIDSRHYWNSWVNADTQDFSNVNNGRGYLGPSDFDPHGGYNGTYYPDMEGESWETVFLHYKEDVGDLDAARPLGFQYAYLGPNNMPTVCLTARNAGGYQVELMVYAMTRSASLCMQDTSADAFANDDTGAVAFCDRGEVYGCFGAEYTDTNPNMDLQVAVYCDTDCEDGQGVDLLWRFRRSKTQYTSDQRVTTDQTDMWCMNIAGSKDYPNDLLAADVPNNVVAGGNEQAGALRAALQLAALAAAALLAFAV